MGASALAAKRKTRRRFICQAHALWLLYSFYTNEHRSEWHKVGPAVQLGAKPNRSNAGQILASRTPGNFGRTEAMIKYIIRVHVSSCKISRQQTIIPTHPFEIHRLCKSFGPSARKPEAFCSHQLGLIKQKRSRGEGISSKSCMIKKAIISTDDSRLTGLGVQCWLAHQI